MTAVSNRSMHGTVLRSLDGYIIVFMLSLKRVLWSVKIDWYIKGYKYSAVCWTVVRMTVTFST